MIPAPPIASSALVLSTPQLHHRSPPSPTTPTRSSPRAPNTVMAAPSRHSRTPVPSQIPVLQSHYDRQHEQPVRRRHPKYPMLNQYILMNVLGSGTFGTVRFALDVNTVKPYAVKIIKKEKAREKILSHQVRKEVAIMQSLQHPNVVKLVRVFSTKSKIYIVMNLITGGELFREVERVGRMTEPYARFFFQQLVRGLDYCHSRGVYHRDLKPENLLLDNDKTLKISDFGLSTLLAMPGKVLNEEKLLRTQCGTPHYVAPEILTVPPGGYLGDKTDVWSCGVILFVLVGGGLPFDDPDATDSANENLSVVFKKIMRCDVKYPPHFSDDLVDLLNHIFKENPRDRYSLKEISRHSWFLGPIVTSQGPDDFAGREQLAPDLEKNVKEIMEAYDQYKQTGYEHSGYTNTPGNEHAIEITPGGNGIPIVRAPALPSSVAHGSSTDSLALGQFKDSRETGLRFLQERAASRSDDVPVPENDLPSYEASYRLRDGKPTPEQLTRVLSQSMRSKFGSHSSQSSDDDHGSDLEYAHEIGGDRNSNSKSSQKADANAMAELRKTLRRTRSAVDVVRSESLESDNLGSFNPNEAGMAERFRADLWNMAGATFREETAKANVPVNERNPGFVRLTAPEDLQRTGIMRSKSFGGPFEPQVLRKPNSRLRPGKKVAWGPPPISSRRSGGVLPARRQRRRESISTLSPLANTPVMFAQGATKRSTIASNGATGHEWKPYEHHDVALWCKMMRDYDMIPDYEEFGMESGDLDNAWKQELMLEKLLPVQSIPQHGSTTFVLSRSSMELSSRAWREKSRKLMSTDATPATAFSANPRASTSSIISVADANKVQDADGDFLTHDDLPVAALREFVERRGLASFYAAKVGDGHIGNSYDVRRLRAYRNLLLSRSGAAQSQEGAQSGSANVPLPESSESRLRNVDMLSTPPGVAVGLLQTSSSQSVTSSLRYPDMPSRHSRDGDNLPYNSSPRSTMSSRSAHGRSNQLRQIATGPLRGGYGAENGDSASSDKSFENGKEQAELNSQNMFRLDIPGPEIRPPLPEPRPFSRVLRPTTRVAKRFLSPRMPTLPLKRLNYFHSLADVERCHEIIKEILTNYGCEVRQEKKKGGKFRLRVSVDNGEDVLTCMVEVFAVDSTVTQVDFERKSGDQSGFLNFFIRIRQLHGEFTAAQNGERNESGS